MDRIVRRTSRGLALITLGLIAALLTGVGVITATVAIGAAERAVDGNLAAAAQTRLVLLEQQLAQQPPDGGDDDDDERSDPGGDNSGPGSDNSGNGGDADDDDDDADETAEPSELPSPSPTASAGFGLPDIDDRTPGSADTFFLLLAAGGEVISNPQRVSLAGLPDVAAADAAIAAGDDWRTVNGDGVPIRLLSQPVRDQNGGLAGVLQSGFVLTLQAEQNRQILLTIILASVAGLLGAAAVTLAVTGRAMRPIRTAFAAERRFVAAASHELRTPVAVMRASAEILQREDLIKPEGSRLVEDIVGESDRLGRLIGDMLALASADAGAITIDKQAIEMRSFVADLARRTDSLASQRGVRLEVVQDGAAGGDEQLIVDADPDRMTQLLMIFIDNAIDHSPAGGTVRLVVRTMGEGVRQRVEVGVADQGPGVPIEERARIFEPFARLAGRRRETGNTGLGLAIARILAARQNATLCVDDALGGGALFSVSLPRLPLAGAAPRS